MRDISLLTELDAVFPQFAHASHLYPNLLSMLLYSMSADKSPEGDKSNYNRIMFVCTSYIYISISKHNTIYTMDQIYTLHPYLCVALWVIRT